MSFNGDEFNSLKTRATTDKLSKLSKNMCRLPRSDPPLRGFAVKGRKEPEKAVKFLNEMQDALISGIQSESGLTSEQKEHFLTWEKFQRSQKGPAAPVEKQGIEENVVQPISHPESFVISEDMKKLCEEVADQFYNYLRPYVSLDIRTINYEEEGRKLPSSTVRGFPFHALGSEVDDEIINQAGNTFRTAFDFFSLSTQNVCFPGGRIQGKPWPGPAKVRIVMIPCVFYQYIIVGIVSKIMEQAKNALFFDGGKEPLVRSGNICDTIEDADEDGYLIIQLDFSAFDKLFLLFFRKLVGEKVGLRLMKECPEVTMFKERLYLYFENQFIFLGKTGATGGRDFEVYPLPNQLLSGVKNTQLDGSGVNAIIQGAALKDAFDVNINYDYSRALGDDAALPVPISVLSEYGYEGVLEKLAKSFEKMGFTVNPKKAYPNTDLAFLQKLYVPKLDIRGAGTGARSMASFLFKEKFTEAVPGVKSLVALEIVSQISIMSEAYALRGTDLSGFSAMFADFGLREDEVLRFIIQEYKKTGLNDANSFFKYLIKLTGLSFDEILAYNDSLSYDHSGLSSKLQSSDYGETFKIIPYLLQSEVSRKPVRDKIREQFNDELLVVDSDLNSDDIITD